MANKKKYTTKTLELDNVLIDEIILLDGIDLCRHTEYSDKTPILLNDGMSLYFNWYTHKGMSVKYQRT